MEEKEIKIIVNENDEPERLDAFLTKKSDLSRSFIRKLMDDGKILVNNKKQKPSYKVQYNDSIIIDVPPPEEAKAIPQDIPINIIYQDKDIIIVNKPAGMVVHPAAGSKKDTLVNALLYHIKDLSSIGGELKPGIVHRLDKDTSGLMMVAKNDNAHANLQKQIMDREVKKVYLALVRGIPKLTKGVIEEPIGRHPVYRQKMAVIKNEKLKSRDAITHYNVIKRFKGFSLLELEIKTGRTHQIRVHLSYLGYPVVGDTIYSRKKEDLGATRQLLHAHKLGFKHPSTGKYLEFVSELPEDFKSIVDNLE